jgi:hypothetical protein
MTAHRSAGAATVPGTPRRAVITRRSRGSCSKRARSPVRISGTRRRTWQKASAILWALGVAVVVVGWLAMRGGQGSAILLVVAAILIVTLFLFASLTVEVTDTEVRLSFGAGVIQKSFQIDEIRDVRVVKNAWYYGWGIHMTPHGWLFNVAGSEAVELTFDSGTKVRIGSDEPSRLMAAIRLAMADTSA